MSSKIPSSVGDLSAQQRFIDSHQSFLEEFPTLQSVLREGSRLAQDKCYPEPPVAEVTDDRLAHRVVFYLEEAASEEFGELLILAGNGMGIGAKKTLRGIYEKLVTAMFIAKYPAEVRIFLNHAEIEKGKVLNRALETTPELLKKDLTHEQISKIQNEKKAAEANKEVEYCKKCRQPITDAAWTRVNLDAMAKKTDENLRKLYATCYLSPTLLAHATPFGLDMRFGKTQSGPEAHIQDSVWRGHYLMLLLLRHQDEYLGLGLKQKIDTRFEAFDAIWRELHRAD